MRKIRLRKVNKLAKCKVGRIRKRFRLKFSLTKLYALPASLQSQTMVFIKAYIFIHSLDKMHLICVITILRVGDPTEDKTDIFLILTERVENKTNKKLLKIKCPTILYAPGFPLFFFHGRPLIGWH